MVNMQADPIRALVYDALAKGYTIEVWCCEEGDKLNERNALGDIMNAINAVDMVELRLFTTQGAHEDYHGMATIVNENDGIEKIADFTVGSFFERWCDDWEACHA